VQGTRGSLETHLWCPESFEESRLIYSNIMYDRLQAVIERDEMPEISDIRELATFSYLGIRRKCGLTEVTDNPGDYQCQADVTVTREWAYQDSTFQAQSPWRKSEPSHSDEACVTMGQELELSWSAVPCMAMYRRNQHNSKNHRYVSYISYATICTRDTLDFTHDVLVDAIKYGREESVEATLLKLKLLRAEYAFIVSLIAMSIPCCYFCYCCAAVCLEDIERENRAVAISTRISNSRLSVSLHEFITTRLSRVSVDLPTYNEAVAGRQSASVAQDTRAETPPPPITEVRSNVDVSHR